VTNEGFPESRVEAIEIKPKRHHSVHATRLIHEHYGALMAFVYSRAPLEAIAKDRFLGEWDYLHLALFELPEARAVRALIELALYIRVVDDDEGQASSKLRANYEYGKVTKRDGSLIPLRYREVANKVIHAERYEWHVSPPNDPTVICYVGQDQAARGYDWVKAEIDLIALGALCGGFMS
jgi:hypothetical protein